MTQKEAPVRANAGMRYDLWLAEEALYRVEVLRLGAVALSLALPAVPAVALLVLLGSLGYSLTDRAVLECVALLLASAAVAYLVPTVVARRRRRLSSLTFAQAKASDGTKKISWDQVRRIVLTKRTTLRMELRRGRFTTQVVRAAIDQNDANRAKSIIVRSKPGRTFEFRDGILK